MGTPLHRNINIRGTIYPTVAEAAKACGVTPDCVRIALRKGRLDNVGIGRGRRAGYPVRVRGNLYPNVRAAAEDLGLTTHAIYRALEEGREDTVGLPQRYNSAMSRPISIGPLHFPSMRAASIALGFGEGYVSQALRRKSGPAWENILAAAMRHASSCEREAA